MFCVKCGVRLADTEKSCPLCGTVVYHPELQQQEAQPLYPKGKLPKVQPNSKAFNGILIILFLIPMMICLLSDLQENGKLDWFGLAAGGLLIGYIALALPLWFTKPNPVIFVPCNFATTIAYLLYVNVHTNGNWFMSFAFPVAGGLCLITCAAVTLLYYLRKGRLFVWGGVMIALGGLILLMEFLLSITFRLSFVGWSVYPLVVLALFGVLLIYLAISPGARETLARKLFF